ncbi:hypothetical protein Aperf_G00000105272 [Anoplocephala perfoliata]
MSLSGLGALCLILVGFGFTCLPKKVKNEKSKHKDKRSSDDQHTKAKGSKHENSMNQNDSDLAAGLRSWDGLSEGMAGRTGIIGFAAFAGGIYFAVQFCSYKDMTDTGCIVGLSLSGIGSLICCIVVGLCSCLPTYVKKVGAVAVVEKTVGYGAKKMEKKSAKADRDPESQGGGTVASILQTAASNP